MTNKKELIKETIEYCTDLVNSSIDDLMEDYATNYDGDFEEQDGEYYFWEDAYYDDDGNLEQEEGYNSYIDDFCSIADECGEKCFSRKYNNGNYWSLKDEELDYCYSFQEELEKSLGVIFNTEEDRKTKRLRTSSCTNNALVYFKKLGFSPSDCVNFIYVDKERTLRNKYNGRYCLATNYFICCPYNDYYGIKDKQAALKAINILRSKLRGENKI